MSKQVPTFQRPRRPVPEPVELFVLTHPAVPAGQFDSCGGTGLEGLRILHLSDLHVRRHRPESRKFGSLCRAVAAAGADLVAITGDCMDEPGQESQALAALRDLSRAWNSQFPPCLGAFLVLGNHDSAEFAARAHGALAEVGIRLLRNETIDVTRAGRALFRVVGLSWPEDALSALLSEAGEESVNAARSPLEKFTLTLAHMPGAIFTAADLGLPLVLAGHTHAGQVRVSPRFAPHTSSDVPVDLASGVLRLRSTLCCVSRGIGDGMVEGLRINCPWQVPLYTLRHGPLPPLLRGASAHSVHQMLAW